MPEGPVVLDDSPMARAVEKGCFERLLVFCPKLLLSISGGRSPLLDL
jgi:hypothetical protein